MAIKVKLKQRIPQIELDLRGPQGNVFFLVGAAKKLCRQLALDESKILKRMLSGDYYLAVKIFDAYFGDYVTLFVDDELEAELAKA